MSTTTQPLRKQLIEQIEHLDERHLTALQAFLRVLDMSSASALPTTGPIGPTPLPADTSPDEDAAFLHTLDELHGEQKPKK